MRAFRVLSSRKMLLPFDSDNVAVSPFREMSLYFPLLRRKSNYIYAIQEEKKDTERWQPAAHTYTYFTSSTCGTNNVIYWFSKRLQPKIKWYLNCLSGIDSFARVCGAIAVVADDEESKCVCDNENDVIAYFCWLQNNFVYSNSNEACAQDALHVDGCLAEFCVFFFLFAVIFFAKWMIYNISCWNWSWV